MPRALRWIGGALFALALLGGGLAWWVLHLYRAAYALVTRCHGGDAQVLLTRLSASAAHPGRWTLPGGGVDHGEHPSAALAREVEEECGLACEVGALVGDGLDGVELPSQQQRQAQCFQLACRGDQCGA